VDSSIIRYRESPSVTRLARVTTAVESGFLAAGITVCLIAALETVFTVVKWLI